MHADAMHADVVVRIGVVARKNAVMCEGVVMCKDFVVSKVVVSRNDFVTRIVVVIRINTPASLAPLPSCVRPVSPAGPTHDGHPLSHGHATINSRVRRNSSS